MAVMGPESFAFPLTVLVGSIRYVFAPGRDVTVGYGQGWDIPLDGPATPPSPTQHPEIVLRFAGNQWVAVDRSPNGILVDGYRVPTVNVRDGQAITIGDPQRGPRLIFHVGAPAAPPGSPPGRSAGPPARARGSTPSSPATAPATSASFVAAGSAAASAQPAGAPGTDRAGHPANAGTPATPTTRACAASPASPSAARPASPGAARTGG